MAPHEWQTEPQEAGQTIDALNGEAGTRVSFAVECAKGLSNLTDLDVHLVPNPVATDVLGHHWQVVDLAHTRWATSTAITALDPVRGRPRPPPLRHLRGDARPLRPRCPQEPGVEGAHRKPGLAQGPLEPPGLRGDSKHPPGPGAPDEIQTLRCREHAARQKRVLRAGRDADPGQRLVTMAKDLAIRHVASFLAAAKRGDLT